MIGKKINQLATELSPVSTDLTIIGDPISGVSKKITLAQLGAIFSGAVSFYTDLASFPATGDINVIYCAKDTQKLYLWSGSAYTEVFPSQALLDTYQLRSEKGNANGYASLDSGGKVPISQLPSSIMEYKGTWNASTNTPTLANGTGDTGDVYICNVAGTVNFGAGPLTFAVGDYVIYSGTIWQRSSGAVGTVTSVALTVGGDAISVSGSPLTTSGTLGLTFNGTTAQYIRGNGTLETFPTSLISGTGNVNAIPKFTANTVLGNSVMEDDGNFVSMRGLKLNLIAGTGNSINFQQASGIIAAGLGYSSIGAASSTGIKFYLDQNVTTRSFVLDTTTITSDTERTYSMPNSSGTLALTSDIPSLTGYVPYTGATANLDLGSYDLTTDIINLNQLKAVGSGGLNIYSNSGTHIALMGGGGGAGVTFYGGIIGTTGSFTSSGSSDTFGITHSSGSGIALNITKGGNGEGLYINKTSGSGNAATIIGTLNATTLVKSGGTSTQFLKADGSVDSNTYLTTSTASSTYVPYTGASANVNLGANDLLSRSVYIEGTASFQAGLLMKQLSVYNFVTGAYTQIAPSTATELNIVHNQANTTRRRYALSVAALQDGDSFQYLVPRKDGTFAMTSDIPSLTGYVQGSGTTNYLPKFTGASTIGNSIVQDDGSSVTIGGVLQSFNASPIYLFSTASTSNYEVLAIDKSSTDARIRVYKSGTGSYRNLIFETGGSTRLTLDTSGNLGLGVTPSAWDTSTNVRVLQMNAGSLWGFSTTAFLMVQNSFSNTSGVRTYVNNGFASEYEQASGQHIWKTATSGTAGNAISFTQAMTLTSGGNLLVGDTTNSGDRLRVVGTDYNNAAYLLGGSTTGASYGLQIRAGSNSSDYSLLVQSRAGSDYLKIAGTGAATFSSSVTATIFDSTSNAFRFSGNNALSLVSLGGQSVVKINAAGYWGVQLVGANDQGILINNVGRASIGTDQSLARLNVKNSSIGSITRGLALYNNGSDGVGTGVSLDFYVNAGDDDRCARIISTQSTAGLYADLQFHTSNNALPVERMRITSGGNVVIGATSSSHKLRVIDTSASQGTVIFSADNAIYNSIQVYAAGADGYNTAATVMIMGRNTSTSRSLNAGGTINASGADYAEYMTKAITENIAKGDIIGIDANGLLTNIYADAISFVVKSTDPSYVGGDNWGSGLKGEDLEKERQKVDRVAFSGQVPCNVINAKVGDYIIPINVNGKIKGEAVTNPTFEQYQISVGKVWKIMEDGRAWIAIKIG
jgi:hypothetical protein